VNLAVFEASTAMLLKPLLFGILHDTGWYLALAAMQNIPEE